MKFLKRFAPILIILAGMAVVYTLGLHSYLSFETLKGHRQTLLSMVEHSPFRTLLAYMGLYTLVVVFSIPGAALMTLVGGFLFGQILGTVSVVLAATMGATVLFLVARSAIGNLLREKAAPWFNKMEKGFQKNQFNYLLVLRLVPLFPFFIVNLVPAFFRMGVGSFCLATFIGIIPGTFVYTSVGVGLGSIFQKGEAFSPKSVLTPEVFLALGGLAVLSAIPLLYKLIRRPSETKRG